MLSAADAAIARRDPLLPDLALLLDPERLQASMERTLRRALERPVIVYLRYKRGQSCLASCRMEVEGLPVEFAVKHHRPDADKLGLVMERPAVAGPLGPGRFVLEGTTLVVSVFPNDGKLKKLAWLDSPDAIAAVARRVNGGDAGFAEIHTLHFNPERRFVGRLTIDGCNRATVRCYRRPDFEDARARTGVLLSQGPLRLARWLFEEESSSVAVLEWLRGRSLEDIIAGQPGADARLRLAGAALAELHGQQPRALPRRTPSAEAAAIAALAHDLSELCPELERDARRLAVRIAERLSGVGDADVRPIHGDFYARQVVVDGETAGILDLDGAALGPAAVDFGRFRADLDSAAIRGRLAPADAEAAIDVLLDGYEGTSGRRPADLDVYSAAQLFYLTTHPFRRREAAWPDRTLALLERAGDVLERRRRSAAAQPARRPVDPFGAMNDPSFPFLREALDPSASGRRLSELPAFSARAVEVRHATVSRHKPGRRCLITYVVDSAAGPETLIGKVRARGPDAATDRLLKRLWGGDFSPRSADGICVPEPLGVVEDFRMTVQRAVPGAPLDRLLDGPSGRRLARRAAEAIAKLHLVPAATSRRHTAEDEISILQRHLSKLNDECPGLRDRLAALAGRCARLADGVAHDPVCGIHRDFYPGQLLADEDHVYLLDLDLYSEGHPAIDVGNFLAHIDEYGIRRFGDAGRLADRKRVFVDRYLKLSTRTSRHAIAACEALSLARLVALSRNFPDRRPHTEALLHLAEERAAQAAAGSAAGRREAPDPRPTEVARP